MISLQCVEAFSPAQPGEEQNHEGYGPQSGQYLHSWGGAVTLSLHQQPTIGNESVTVGNGQELPVTHIGNGKLITPSHDFKLDNILCVPQLASNLLSIHKLCLQNNAFCYFDA